tara:strand:+ start:187 stop:474 length:288 start_codon:yes stop_codon:yes gene_type:complete
MKYSLLAVVFLTLLSCHKFKNKAVTVVRDCTGTYLRLDEKDYHVCNYELLKDYNDGDQLRVSFKAIDKCPRFDSTYVCLMAHLNEGLIEVEKVKP